MKVFLIIFILPLILSNINALKPVWNIHNRHSVHLEHLNNENLKNIDHSQLAADEWFEQRLDHDLGSDSPTWRQKYHLNANYYNETLKGPIILYIGGEGPTYSSNMASGAWIEWAEEHSALLMQLEHRFYGESKPLQNMSAENLQYLHTKQALSDIAYFIEQKSKEYPEGTKWITYGGSYAGSLTAWTRLLYPDLILGGISVSGPLLAKVHFPEYLDVVYRVLEKTKIGCGDKSMTSFEDAVKLLTSEEGASKMNEMFSICEKKPVYNDLDARVIVESIMTPFLSAVQYRDSLLLNDYCDTMTSENGKELIEHLAEIYAADNTCFVNFDQYIEYFMIDYYDVKQWTYQTCAEFGWYLTLSVDFSLKFCEILFDMSEIVVDGNVNLTNSVYHEQHLNVSNVLYIHGEDDPWRPLGIYETIVEESPAILIKDTAHCEVMYSAKATDSEDLQNARKQVSETIGKWLKQ